MSRNVAVVLMLAGLVGISGGVRAQSPQAGETALSFADFYRRPIGPRGLEATTTLLSLSGQRVVMSGYAVHGADLPEHLLILAPMPLSLSDEDERLADDLPASVVYVDTSAAALSAGWRQCEGRLVIQGELQTGPRREPDERTSYVRLRALVAQCLAAPSRGPAVASTPHRH